MKRMLYVDDESEDYASTIRAIGRDRGYRVYVFHESMDAMNAMSRLNYDVAFIDRSFFGQPVSGEELMELSKQNYPKVPVVCISAYEDKPKFADHVLRKAFDFDKLFDTVDFILESNSKQI